ncbi:MAG: hypothetical protein ACXV7G_09345 [Halobacteriota archaeon]
MAAVKDLSKAGITFDDNEALCLSLVRCDSEAEVTKVLKNAGYWDNDAVWENFGDTENNFATIGNQQSNPEAALVEKIINSIDAVLMAECYSTGIKPYDKESPRTISDALESYFDIPEGRLNLVSPKKRTELAQNICLVATGAKTNPCYSVIDRGEGQTPDKMPDTLLSLGKSNKLRIPFVQGKFNMGGTGVFQFCGQHNLQLIVSKRHPSVTRVERDVFKERDDSASEWGFTVVRRDDPSLGVRNSTYRYLAPGKKILRFRADDLPVLPGDYPQPYEKGLQWGTLIKLYEYQMPGFKTNILFDLYNRLSLLMPTPALPIRLYERRLGYEGRSLETTLAGLTVRILDDRNENVEDGFPLASDLVVKGREMAASIYAFKRDRHKKYKKKEGILFTINGQTHGTIKDGFFKRRTVDLSYLADSLLIELDCTNFDGRSREDLFMNSRDRLREGELKSEIETQLETLLKSIKILRDLKTRRRDEDIGDKVKGGKPLADVISEVLKNSPTLSKLFLEGVRLPNPFKPQHATAVAVKLDLKKFPTYFELVEEYPSDKPKYCAINRRFRLRYRTDAKNDYLHRPDDKGSYSLSINGGNVDRAIYLDNGIAYLEASLPANVQVGDLLHFVSEVTDSRPFESFKSEFHVKVGKPELKSESRTSGRRGRPPSDEIGGDTKSISKLALPQVIEVEKDGWEPYDFDDGSALLVRGDGEGGYDFYINVDNIHLLTEMKADTKNAKLLKARYEYGQVLIGLALLHQDAVGRKPESDESGQADVFEEITSVSRAISPFLLPMIATLGGLPVDEMPSDEADTE